MQTTDIGQSPLLQVGSETIPLKRLNQPIHLVNFF